MGGDPLTSVRTVDPGGPVPVGRATVGAVPDLIVPRRFCGPPSSGNGGYTAGALADRVDRAGRLGLAAGAAPAGHPDGGRGRRRLHRRDRRRGARSPEPRSPTSTRPPSTPSRSRRLGPRSAPSSGSPRTPSRPASSAAPTGPTGCGSSRARSPTRTAVTRLAATWTPDESHTSTTCPPSPGPRSTASAAGPAASPTGRWCWPG